MSRSATGAPTGSLRDADERLVRADREGGVSRDGARSSAPAWFTVSPNGSTNLPRPREESIDENPNRALRRPGPGVAGMGLDGFARAAGPRGGPQDRKGSGRHRQDPRRSEGEQGRRP